MNINNLNSKILRKKTTIVLDWLSIYFIYSADNISEPILNENNETFSLKYKNDLTIEYTGGGQKHFKYIWNIYIKKTLVATLLTHTRNEKFFKKNVCKIDFKNFLFYSNEIWNVYNTIKDNISLLYKGVARVDIAIDGCNYLIYFLRQYYNQSIQNKKFEFKGNSRLSSKILDRKTMLFQNYTVGTPKGHKYITIYNKSLDILKTGKDYIQDFFLENKITNKILPSEIIKDRIKKNNEIVSLDGYQNVFRFELRLDSQAIKEIESFDLILLKNVNGLMSIVKIMCQSFFDPYLITNKQSNRCENFDILPYKKYEIIYLEKINKTDRTDIFKTKMAIHLTIKQIIFGEINLDNYSVIEMILFHIKNQKLEKWFVKKYKNNWIKIYSAISQDEIYTTLANELIENEIISNLNISTND